MLPWTWMTVLCSLYVFYVNGVANLKYFETFSEIGVETRVKRSPNDVLKYIKELKFHVFNRHFHLHLTPGMDVLAHDFEAQLIHEDETTPYYVEDNNLFTGYIIGNPDVKVSAFVDGDLWFIQILDKEDKYAIEPSKFVLSDVDNPNNETFVAYRASDLINTGARCGSDPFKEMMHKLYSINYTEPVVPKINNAGRSKRNTEKTTCLIQIFADYAFFKKRCKRNAHVCTATMITMVNFVDTIFRQSPFQGSNFEIYKDYGLQILSMGVYTTYSHPVRRYDPHFNAERVWTAEKKLLTFASYMGLRDKKYCLSGLLTSHLFTGRIVGLAATGAVCSKDPLKSPQKSVHVVTSEDILGPLTSLHMTLVLAHEIAHNYGSEHDPDTPECSAPDNKGGNYLMWPIAVNGDDKNNQKFSPCSLKHIGQKIEEVECFSERSVYQAICGNGIVDEGEDCDDGDKSHLVTSCCSETCRLRRGNNCSDLNTVCCLNCQPASNGTLCFDASADSCMKDSHCHSDNDRSICLQSEAVPDRTPCLESGSCFKGVCRGYCESKSIVDGRTLKPCFCHSTGYDACRYCCYDNTDPVNPGPCQPYSDFLVPEGRKCYAGFCVKGFCKNVQGYSVMRIVAFLKKASISSLVKFFKSNVVIVIIVLSLCFFIPIVYLTAKLEKIFYEEILPYSGPVFRQVHLKMVEYRENDLQEQVESFDETESDI